VGEDAVAKAAALAVANYLRVPSSPNVRKRPSVR